MASIPYTDRYTLTRSLYKWLIHTCHCFVRFALWWAVFELWPLCGKCTEWPQMTLRCSRSKIPILCMLHTPWRSIFVNFSLRWAVFGLRPKFRKTCTKWPWHVQGQTYQHWCYIHPRDPFFVRFALQLTLLELRPNFRKSARNDPKWPWHAQGQKYQHACYIHPRGPDFRPFHSTMSLFFFFFFLSYGQIFGKGAPNHPKSPWHVQGPKYQCACYKHSSGPNFRLFPSTTSHFRDTA